MVKVAFFFNLLLQKLVLAVMESLQAVHRQQNSSSSGRTVFVCVCGAAVSARCGCYLKVSGVHWNALDGQALPNVPAHSSDTQTARRRKRAQRRRPADTRTVCLLLNFLVSCFPENLRLSDCRP